MDKVLIYDRVLMDMSTMRVIEASAHWHSGEVALCGGGKGGGGGGTEPDYAYNARMATIAERQQDLSDKYFEFWEENNAVLEAAKIKAELSNVDQQDAVTKQQLAIQQKQNENTLGNIDQENRIYQGVLGMQENTLGTTGELAQSYLKESLDGVNGDEWANRAGLDQQLAASNANAQLARNAARMGLNLNSGSFQSAMADQATKSAANVASARTQAFRDADKEKYNRLGQGLSAGLGLLSK